MSNLFNNFNVISPPYIVNINECVLEIPCKITVRDLKKEELKKNEEMKQKILEKILKCKERRRIRKQLKKQL
jgi:hypothetical protein